MAEAMAATEDAAWRVLGPSSRVDRFEEGHYRSSTWLR
jgi:hypothetical protein